MRGDRAREAVGTVTNAQAGRPAAGSLPRPVLALGGAAAATVVVLGLHAMADLVTPVFLAMVLVVLVHPLRSRLRARGVPGWAAAVALLLLVYGALAALVVSLVVSVSRFAALLPSYRAEWDRVLDRAGEGLTRLGMGAAELDDLRASLEPARIVSGLGDALGGLLGVMSMLLLVVSVVFFMTLDAAWFTDRLSTLPGRRRLLADALGTFASGTRRYLLVSTVFGLVVALLDTAALWWLGVPAAVLWGLLAFVTNYIPNIGFFLGLIPPAVLGLLEGGPSMLLAVVAVYTVINFVIQSLIQPRIVGGAVGLSGTITMLSLIFWAAALGPLGALLAVPLSLFAKALLVDADPSAAWLRGLLAPHPTVPGDTRRTHDAPLTGRRRR